MTLILMTLLACGDSSPAVQAPAAPTAAGIVLKDPKAIAALPAADAVDGTVDHAVTRCSSCGLGMDGDPAHVSRIGDYTLHSCSDSCKQNLESNADGVLARLDGIGTE